MAAAIPYVKDSAQYAIVCVLLRGLSAFESWHHLFLVVEMPLLQSCSCALVDCNGLQRA